MRPPLEVEIESRWRWNVRGPGSWSLCQQAGRRKPAWSRAARAWVISERTGRDLLAMAEAAGLSVVMTGPRATELQLAQQSTAADGPATEPEAGLW